MNDTLSYYNHNADVFIEGTQNADMSEQYNLFLPYLPASAHILDLGCGSGRDSAYFSSLGYEVTAVDGSAELCKRVTENMVLTHIACDLRRLNLHPGLMPSGPAPLFCISPKQICFFAANSKKHNRSSKF